MYQCDVTTTTGAPLGIIYLDLLSRPDKFSGSAHFVVRCGRRIHGFEVEGDGMPLAGVVTHTNSAGVEQQYQLPIVTIAMSFAHSGRAGADMLSLSLAQVETLFHEFGHALHSMLSRTDYQHLSGACHR